MTTVDDIRARFDAARDTFEIEEGQPNEAYVTKIEETIGGILFGIRYDAETARHNLIGLVMPEAEYAERFAGPFVRPARPKAYDDGIDVKLEITLATRKAEAVWKAKIADWELYDVAESEANRFIVDAVDDVWLAELKKKTTIYAEVLACEMLTHLRAHCLGEHEIDILDLQDQMRQYHVTAASIPQYIEAMEKAHMASKRANNEISEAMMVNMATKAMLSTERYPKANDDWENLAKSERTWKNGKSYTAPLTSRPASRRRPATRSLEERHAELAMTTQRKNQPETQAPSRWTSLKGALIVSPRRQ